MRVNNHAQNSQNVKKESEQLPSFLAFLLKLWYTYIISVKTQNNMGVFDA
jgi:hypothetical protein